ncbi:MAG: DNA mismatch repair endonuclease MutL [Deltaproteobacteria bacterium]|nr:DNA mismatch repair endonuclease MutL [Deltaproteobacteria bacterium]
MKIILLPESWVSRIAAGEVVERPASVVKELVENALDAGAKEISVWVEGSGSSLIRVSDDGEGIASEELPLALERHSTSKVKDEGDLFCISTLGFRGEALPSIGSVSKLELVSRARQEEVGCRLRVEGGKKGEAVVAGCPVGTTVEVRELFFNTPARRKFLKSPATELSHISDVINRMALAYGDVHFRLHHAGRMLCDYVAALQHQDRLRQVLGPEVADGMVSFSWVQGKMKISGFLSIAPSSFSNSRYLLTYVNRRFVRDRILTHAVLEGYETLLMKGRYPAVALYLDIPYEEVDVNVHPAKYEVRFRHQSEVHDAVVEAVRERLKREAKGPSPKAVQDREQPFFEVRERPLPYPAPSLGGSLRFPEVDSVEAEANKQEIQKGFFSSLVILGQLLGCYLVCASPRGMVLIDQHAAHERIAFEKMRYQLEQGAVERQNLLIPQLLELPYAEAIFLEQILSTVDHLGFTVEGFGPNTFAIKAAPALLPPGDYREVMRQMVAEFAEVGRNTELRQGLEERLMTIACHSVIRANRKLEREEIRALLGELDQIDFATQCPHGRPVLLEFTQEQLERMFKRA